MNCPRKSRNKKTRLREKGNYCNNYLYINPASFTLWDTGRHTDPTTEHLSPVLRAYYSRWISPRAYAAILAVRSIGEENMLRQELDGYNEYMGHVRWRLIPYIF